MRSDRKALPSKKLRINESPVYDLGTQYDSRQSFYGKARVDSNGDTQVLYSYDTPVVKIEGGRVYLLPMWDSSPTTLRHVKEFLKQNGFRADSKQQIAKAYEKSDVDDSMRQRGRNRYELSPQYDSRQSFYGKAHVERDGEGFDILYSYNTPVVKIKGDTVYLLPLWDSSNTTLRHVKEFLRQNGFEAGTRQQIARAYKQIDESKSSKRSKRKVESYADKSGTVSLYVDGVWKFTGGFNGLARALQGIMNDDATMQACIDYCNSFGDPLIEEPFISPRDVAYTTADVVEAEYNDADSAKDFSVYIGDYRNGVNIEIFGALK